jgi:hypothetical protein
MNNVSSATIAAGSFSRSLLGRMGEYVAEGNLGAIPDDLTLSQFILDSTHPTRPIREEGIPWLIDDTTGRKIGFEEVSRESTDDEFVASGSVRLTGRLLKIAAR